MTKGLMGVDSVAKSITKELNKVHIKNSERVHRKSFLQSFKSTIASRPFISKMRNALIIFLAVLVVFKAVAFIAGRYLAGESFASFIAYFSFFSLVAMGLIMSVYFPIRYSESSFSFSMPSMRKLGSKGGKESEVEAMLKNERKNTMKLSKEHAAASKALSELKVKCAKLESQNSDLAKKNKELENNSKSSAKKDSSSIFGFRLGKKEVVSEEKEVNRERPKAQKSAGLEKLSGKLKRLPKEQGERIALYRSIARSVQSTGGSFTISRIMEALIELFRQEVDADRAKILKELEEWVNEDAYTPLIRVEKGIRHHRIIK